MGRFQRAVASPSAQALPEHQVRLRPGALLGGLVVVAALMTVLTTAEGALYRASRGDDIALSSLAAGRLADWYTCAVLIPPLYWVTRRWPIEQGGWRLAVAIHLTASSCASVLKYLLYVPLRGVVDPSYGTSIAEAMSADFLGKLMFFWAAIGMLHAIFFYQREQAKRAIPDDVLSTPESSSRPSGARRIGVLAANGTHFVAADEIDWIEAQGNYALIHAGERRHLLRETMSRLIEQLDPSAFVRVHRSVIVNVHSISRVEPAARGRYQLTLSNGATVTTGRSFKERVHRMLE
jgi:hypothetical protein